MYRIVGDDHYTTVAVPGYEKDPAVTAAIREFDPGAVPIWRVQMWLFPGEFTPRNVVHHGLASYFPFPRRLRAPLRIWTPADTDEPAPNLLQWMFEDQETLAYKQGGPGGYEPWDWSAYRFCRAQFDRFNVETFDQAVEARKARIEKAHDAWVAELEYIGRQIEGSALMKKLQESTAADWQAYWKLLGSTPEAKAARAEMLSRGRKSVAQTPTRSPRGRAKTYGRVAPDQGV